MNKFKHVEMKVNEILFENPDTRDDDNLLFCEYLKSLESDYNDLADQIMINKIATKMKSVERARRKLQERNPVLRGDAWIKRHKTQEDFIQYARE